MRPLRVFLLLFGYLGVVSCTGDDDGRITVRMATLFGKDHHLAKKLEWMAKELEERSNGRFKCSVFPGGVVGGEKENLEDLLTGSLEVMNGAGSYYYLYVPEASVLELPLYGWQDKAEAHRTIRAYWEKFAEVSARQGFYPIGLDIRDYWGVFYREPITTLEAIRGAKFRSVNAALWIELTKVYGAVPNPIAYADAYLAFKTGVADGSLGSLTGAVAANWHEVLKCFVDTRLVLSESFMLTSKAWLDKLPPDLRELFLRVSEESEEFNIVEVEKQYERNKKSMLEAGVKFVSAREVDLTDLKKKAFAFRDTYMSEKGAEVYGFYKAWLAHVETVTGRSQAAPD